jgi:hypothetical protein
MHIIPNAQEKINSAVNYICGNPMEITHGIELAKRADE